MADGERSSLAHRYVATLQKLAGAAELGGDLSAAVGWWRKLVIVDPLNGQLALGLMRAMAAAGDRAGALQHARIYERLVQQELDVSADPAVKALVEELKRPPSDPRAVPAPSSTPPAGARPISADTRPT
ncbi:MAG: bacterial transcriptional activator domain-containing protein [Gemmatimonadaceae bacterium]